MNFITSVELIKQLLEKTNIIHSNDMVGFVEGLNDEGIGFVIFFLGDVGPRRTAILFRLA